jgi:hypothetical protein
MEAMLRFITGMQLLNPHAIISKEPHGRETHVANSSSTCTGAGGTWSTNLCTTTYLQNAYEIFEDGIGNDNGLCESNESCIYTPNIGAYQGEGSLQAISSSFTNGNITNVKLYQYVTNGQ